MDEDRTSERSGPLGSRWRQRIAATAELAARLADRPALAYAATKVLLSRELDLPLQGALELEAVTQALLMTSEDHREFAAAFSEGRSPTWRGR